MTELGDLRYLLPNQIKAGITPVLTSKELGPLISPFSEKFAWFLSKGYKPHLYQTRFHAMQHQGNLCRFRHLVAGRRGGKTLSAAWEMAYYCLHPKTFHRHAYGAIDDRPLWCWALARDNPTGLSSLITFRQVLRECGAIEGKDYVSNKADRTFTFKDGTFLQFKSADNVESLRGAGLDLLWIDEAAFIPNDEAWNRVYPALSDKQGLVITTTTPDGKNWFYKEFFSDDSYTDQEQGRVEYTSIDNPYFKEAEWKRVKARYHPQLFYQEYMASFNNMAGRDLSGDWLHFYTMDEEWRENVLPRLRKYIGIDLAVSERESADRFCASLIGVDDDGTVYLLEQFVDRIPFPDQVQLVTDWNTKYRPLVIGIESGVGYQGALEQHAVRLDPSLPILPIRATGKKLVRILSMTPFFRAERILIRKDQKDFIDEWLDYDSNLKNPHDDTLDSVEIALRTAGILLGDTETPMPEIDDTLPAASLQDLANRLVSSIGNKGSSYLSDDFGDEW